MSFTEAEKRNWHAARRDSDEAVGSLNDHYACDHCGHPIPPGGGNGNEEFRVCDACDSD